MVRREEIREEMEGGGTWVRVVAAARKGQSRGPVQ